MTPPRRCHPLAAALLVLARCTPAERVNARATPPPPPEAPSNAAPEAPDPALAEALAAAQERGWIKGDGSDYFALFAPDAHVCAARGSEPDAHDVHFDSASFRALMHYQFAQAERAVSAFGTPELKLLERSEASAGERRIITQTRELQSLALTERVHETFSYERRGGAWLIVSYRYHPLSFGDIVYGRETLRQLDAAADAPGQDSSTRAAALFSALRFREAAALLASLASAPGASADAQVAYGYSALFAADPTAAESAFTRARQLDPWVVLPPPLP